MRNGFIFKNKHSSEMGVTVKSKSRTLIPGTKEYSYDLPFLDGSYDFSEANEYGRAFYEDRVFEVTMHIYGDNLAELERKTARIASWLTGKGLFKFDDMSSLYNARVISNVAFTPERYGKKADVSVIFQSEAIGRADFNVSDGIELGKAIPLDSNFPLDMSEFFVKDLTAGENTVEIVNIGDFYVRPILTFDGAANITVTYGDSKIMIEDLETDAVMNFEKCIVTNSDGDNLISKMSGKFFELPPGISELEIYASEECQMKIDYTPRTIYDFDFSQIDWGDGNA